MVKRCNYCKKIWFRQYSLGGRILWLLYPERRLEGFPNQLRDPDDPSKWRIITNYHATGWGIYCHNCWPKYLREAEHERFSRT